MNRISLIVRYFLNDRLKEYEKIVAFALQKKYKVTSLRGFIEDLEKGNLSKNFLILRHDIDHRCKATKIMLKKYNVTASFYFRKSTFDFKLMKEIEAYGSEASLHFETIVDFVRANNIKN